MYVLDTHTHETYVVMYIRMRVISYTLCTIACQGDYYLKDLIN